MHKEIGQEMQSEDLETKNKFVLVPQVQYYKTWEISSRFFCWGFFLGWWHFSEHCCTMEVFYNISLGANSIMNVIRRLILLTVTTQKLWRGAHLLPETGSCRQDYYQKN